MLLIAGAVIFAGCTENGADDPYADYERTEGGLRYKKIETTEGSEQAEQGDIVTMSLLYKTEGDSVLFNSANNPAPFMVRIAEPNYPGDLMEGFATLAEGDSVHFVANADTFFNQTGQPRPEFIDSGSNLIFAVKVIDVQSMEEYQQARMEEAQKQQAEEAGKVQQYLAENNITVEPTEEGLYYIQEEEGTGQEADPGDVVRVHYEGKLLDGRTFDSSYERGEPIEFPLGEGRVIQGWDLGIDKMKEGGKATLIIPSALAYGEQSPPGSIISPYSPLVFKVELVEVKQQQ